MLPHYRMPFSPSRSGYFAMGLPFLLVAAAAPAAHAQIANGGFETPVLSGTIQNFSPSQTIGAWTVVGNGGTSVSLVTSSYSEPGNGVSWNPQEGNQSLDLTGPGNVGTSAGVQQTITTIAGQPYALSFFVGKADSSNGSVFYSAPAVADLSINGGARVSFTNADTGTSGTINWLPATFNFTAPGTSTLITFFNGTASSNANEVGLDNVRIAAVSSTPEPGSLALLAGLGLSGSMLRRRRRLR